ncbi:MAG: extracellular solute-binding protein, partial [Anaerolineae bacterium]|nr:extracellular solute-binding protein [Anaerolineae bacterium]
YSAEELSDFFPVAVTADFLPQFAGRYGWPPYKSMEVMYYNEDWLTELGYDGPPETWEEFEAMACAASENPFSGATGDGEPMGYVYSIDASRFATFVFSRGGDIIGEQGTEYVFNEAPGVDALTFWQDLVEKGCAKQATERYGDQTDFGNGFSLFTVSSISGLPYYGQAVDEGADFAWSVNPPPHTGEPRMNIYGASQSIFVSTPEEQLAAWLFIKFMSEPEPQARWASSTGYFPTRQAAADAMQAYMDENPTYAKAFGFMQLQSGVESPVAGYDECRSAISDMLTNILDGGSVETELAEAINLCNEYLWEAAPEGFEGASVKPTPIAVPELAYDKDVYGDLMTLDPSGAEVVYWYQHTGSREELMLELIDEFNRTNEWGITVVGETQGGYNDLYQKIIAGIPANQLPEMAVAYQNQAATYAVQEVLVELDTYMNHPKWGYGASELKDFFPIAMGADILPQFEGRYGWPPYKSMEVMYYNEDWLTELGFDGPPETWDEFEAMACAASENPFSGATGDGEPMGYVYSVDASRFATFVFSRGGNIIAPDGSGYAFGDATGVETLEYWQGLTEKGCAKQATERYGDQTDFGNGYSLFTVSSISGLPYYGQAVDEGADFAWSVNPPPHSTAEPRMNIYGASQSIFVSTPEQQLAAWLFIKFMSEPEPQARWASSTGYFPTRQAAADAMAAYLEENPTYAKAFGFMQLDYGIESPVAGYDECRSAISDMLTNVLDGADVADELSTAVEVCDEYLAEAAP